MSILRIKRRKAGRCWAEWRRSAKAAAILTLLLMLERLLLLLLLPQLLLLLLVRSLLVDIIRLMDAGGKMLRVEGVSLNSIPGRSDAKPPPTYHYSDEHRKPR